MDTKKTAILATASILATILILGCVSPPEETTTQTTQTLPVTTITYKQEDVNNLHTAIASSQSSQCDSITDVKLKDKCFRELAVQKKDSTLCQHISDQNNKDSCYLSLVLNGHDKSICSEISNGGLKNKCLNH